MAEKSIIKNPTYVPKRMNKPIAVAVPANELPKVVERPGYCIGRLLALQQLDGVDGSTHQLFKGQFDEKFGVVDPASNIHVDRHVLQDALIQRAYLEKFPPTPKKSTSSEQS